MTDHDPRDREMAALHEQHGYPAMSHPSADPALMAVSACLAGLSPVHPARANVLEIGCASGHHLIPLARRWPEAWFTGIDRSPRLIAAAREAAAAKMGFSAYGITQGDDPVAQALKGLIDNASSQEHQIALLWRAIETLSAARGSEPAPAASCVPQEAHTTERFDAEGLNRLVK